MNNIGKENTTTECGATSAAPRSTDHSKRTEHGKNCTFKLDRKLLRIEYPGAVQNVDKAMETFGGIERVEMVMSNLGNLNLHFHPENKYNKPCIADRDTNPGVLIRIKTNSNVSNETEINYDVVGVVTTNLKFNRLCDFQFLPIVSEKDDYNTEGEVIYEKICPKKLPSLEWFVSKEISKQKRFHFPQVFSRFDATNYSLYLNPGERFNMFSNSIKPDSLNVYDTKIQKKPHMSAKKLSACISILHPNVKIPEQPSELILAVIKRKGITETYNIVKKIFEERPVWTKAAVQYKLKFSNEYAKVLLPAGGFYCTNGPWRTCWIRYGYNPLKEFGSRIYQTLDFRIRTSAGTSLKVFPKRANTRQKSLGNTDLSYLEERSFILRPHYVPPARQMFYQYCDLLIPEIQDMLQRLPKIPTNVKFDQKNGWLPASFTEQCREIVNKYVLDAVQEELRKENSTMHQDQAEDHEDSDMHGEIFNENEPATYCSRMLSNIRKGIYKSENILPLKRETTISQREGTSGSIYKVDLVEDATQEGNDLITDVNDIPEIMSEPSDEELSEDSDLEIDLEAVEEINELIENTKKDLKHFHN